MKIILIIVIIFVILTVIGKLYQLFQDRNTRIHNPNHPSKFSKRIFPVGSGQCPARKNDRHIWNYENTGEEYGPTNRTCSYCGKEEHRSIIGGSKWRDY